MASGVNISKAIIRASNDKDMLFETRFIMEADVVVRDSTLVIQTLSGEELSMPVKELVITLGMANDLFQFEKAIKSLIANVSANDDTDQSE